MRSHLNNLKSFVVILLFAALALFGGCVSDPVATQAGLKDPSNQAELGIDPDRQVELTELACEWTTTQDDNLMQEVQDEEELNFVQNFLSHENESDDFPTTYSGGCHFTYYGSAECRNHVWRRYGCMVGSWTCPFFYDPLCWYSPVGCC